MGTYEVQAICANGIGLFILFSLLLNIRGKYDKKKTDHFIFILMLLVNVMQCVVEAATVLLDGHSFKGAVALSMALNTVLFIGNVIFAMLWMTYADFRLRKISFKEKSKGLVVYIPGILVIIAILVNVFVPVFFDITKENVYERAWGFPVTYIVSYFYIMWGAALAYVVHNKNGKYVFLPAITFLLPVLAASLLQFIFEGISLLWVGTAIGLMSAYISLKDERAALDPLSGVFTRHYMNEYLDNLCKRAPTGQRVSGVMLDIDRFKMINDTYGHLVGDQVIRKFGSLLKTAVNGKGIVFRYAGDEFIIVVTNYTKERLMGLIGSIHRELNKTNDEGNEYTIACSLGCATYVPGERVSHFLKRMDDAMYANKNEKRLAEGKAVEVEDEELTLAGIDMPDLRSRLMQDKNLIEVFIRKFVEDKSYERLCEAADKFDVKQMETQANLLKGMCSNLSLKTLCELFSEQVQLLKEGKGEQAMYKMPLIAEEYKSSIANMQTWLAKQPREK